MAGYGYYKPNGKAVLGFKTCHRGKDWLADSKVTLTFRP